MIKLTSSSMLPYEFLHYCSTEPSHCISFTLEKMKKEDEALSRELRIKVTLSIASYLARSRYDALSHAQGSRSASLSIRPGKSCALLNTEPCCVNMDSMSQETRSLSQLPNELLLQILDRLPTANLKSLTSISHRFHALSLRLFHDRLTHAASLGAQTLILECYHPSAKLTAGQLFCTSLGTPGLVDALSHGGPKPVGKLAHLGNLYSRFRPQRKEPDRAIVSRIRPGDIPGSRTYPGIFNGGQSSTTITSPSPSSLLVSETVSLDTHELFSQLCCVTNLVTVGPRKGLLLSIVEISDGTIRVWRDWLAAQVGRKSASITDKKELGSDSSILWVNNCQNSVGIKFRVRRRTLTQNNPILYTPEEENEMPEFEGKSFWNVIQAGRLTQDRATYQDYASSAQDGRVCGTTT
jgi:hypothetical protein